MLHVYTVRPYGDEDENGKQKKFWVKIGAAFECRDGSINVKLDALPCNGELNIRKPREEVGADA